MRKRRIRTVSKSNLCLIKISNDFFWSMFRFVNVHVSLIVIMHKMDVRFEFLHQIYSFIPCGEKVVLWAGSKLIIERSCLNSPSLLSRMQKIKEKLLAIYFGPVRFRTSTFAAIIMVSRENVFKHKIHTKPLAFEPKNISYD